MDYKKEILEKLNSRYKYWKEYGDAFEKFSKKIEKRREDLLSKFKDKKDEKELTDDIEKLSMEYWMAFGTLLRLAKDLSSVYTLTKEVGIDVDEDKVEILEKLKKEDKEDVFVAYEGELRERKKGLLNEEIKKNLKSELYKKNKEMLMNK